MRFCAQLMMLGIIAYSSLVFALPKKIIVPNNFATIQKAIDEAEDGDTVFVKNGIYKENIIMRENIFLIGEDVEKTILRGKRDKPVIDGANRCVIRNFTIEQGTTGILCKNTNPLIEHNIIKDNRTGIHALISLPEIRNNIIYGNEWTGIFCELISSSQRTSIDHNFIGENNYCGIMLSRKSEVLIQNNILYKNKQYGIYVNQDSRKSRIIYNDFFGNRHSYNMYAVVNETNIAKDPLVKITGTIQSFGFQHFGGKNYPLSGLGKDGSDIGPMSEDALKGIRVDSDGDGIPDNEDQCPDMPEDFDGYMDNDGCPDYDNDGDGIYDASDRCPNDPEDYDGFQDEDGCSDPDNDGDGIPDKFDKCPNTPEDKNGFQDDDGCPDGGSSQGKQSQTQSLSSQKSEKTLEQPALKDTVKESEKSVKTKKR